MDEIIKGYKVFNPDWTCRDFQYTCPGIFEEDVDPEVCERGFHFCLNLSDCFGYYPFNPENKVAEIICLGKIAGKGDKCCTNKIEIVRELTWEEVLRLVNTGKGCSGLCNSGDWNKTNFSNGCFNTESPKIYLFNKPSDWTYQDWLNSDAFTAALAIKIFGNNSRLKKVIKEKTVVQQIKKKKGKE